MDDRTAYERNPGTPMARPTERDNDVPSRPKFIKNLWYVAAWSTELDSAKPISRTIIGEPIAFYRTVNGTVVGLEDRCPHRHAPLSLGRIEGDDLKCMYHGLKFGRDGVCKFVPGSDIIPPHSTVRTFPAVERSSWIWVWMGDPDLANECDVLYATGLDDPQWLMRESAIDYAAYYTSSKFRDKDGNSAIPGFKLDVAANAFRILCFLNCVLKCTSSRSWP